MTFEDHHRRRVALLQRIADDLLGLARRPASDFALTEADDRDLDLLADLSSRLAKTRSTALFAKPDAAQTASRQLTETLRLTFDEAPIGLFLVDLTGRFLRANQAGADILGYPIAELLQRDFQSLTHPEDLGRDLGHLRSMLAGSLSSYRMEKRYVRKDGSIVWGRLDVGLVHDGDGKPLHFVSHVQDITERVAQDAERRKTESILELTTDFIGMADMQGNLLYHNRAARRLIGLAEDADLTGLKIADMHPSWALELIERQGIPHVLEQGVWTTESAILHRDGTEIPVSQVIILHRDQAGLPLHLSTIMRDLRSERKSNENARRLRDQLQAAIGSLNSGFVMYDRHERLVICNKMYQEMYDLPDRLVQPGISFENVLSDVLTKQTQFVQTLLGEQPAAVWIEKRLAQFRASNTTFVHQLGDRFISVQDRRTPDGGFVSLRSDITELKRAEFDSALKAELLQVAADSADIGIWDYNLTTRELVWDERMRAMYGYPTDAFPGIYEAWADRLHPDDRSATERQFADCIARGAAFQRTFRLRLPDGEIRYIDSRAGYVRDGGGQPIRVVGVNLDVTLAQESAERLRQAVAAAESAGRVKAEFLATMSHEIRTPMNGVIGMANLLFKTPLDLRQREYAENIRSCGESLLTLINDILDFSKLEAGRLELERIPFPLHRLVEEVVALFSTQAEAKGIVLVHDVPPAVPRWVIGDPTRLRQVLSNLVSNAVKFTERGRVEVGVGAEPLPGDRMRIRLAIADSGIGMAPEALARIGQAFTQADASTTRRYGGSGLGLSIVRRLITLMQGELAVRSQAGSGSCFTVTIDVPVSEEAGSGGYAVSLSGRRAVVVSADPAHVETVRELLAHWNVSVDHCGDPARLVDFVSRSAAPPDFLLVDERLSGRTGRELIAQLAARPRSATIPCLLIGEADPRLDGQPDSPPSLRKPVRRAQLQEILQRHLSPVAQALPAGDGVHAPPARRLARVLVVEDNIINQRVISLMLREHAGAVVIAANGVEALHHFREEAWDCIFMDCLMPEMDGFEATKRIRAWEVAHGRARTRIVALTANALPGDREACLAAGMDSYISKPVRASDLAAALVPLHQDATPPAAPRETPSAHVG